MRKSVSILVVEDSNTVLSLLREIVLLEGWNCLEATNGHDAVRISREMEPDLVILDLLLPGLDGFGICERIREFSSMPIIVVSGVLSTEARLKCLNLGVDDYINKPFAIEDIVSSVKAALERKRR